MHAWHTRYVGGGLGQHNVVCAPTRAQQDYILLTSTLLGRCYCRLR